jgi:sugar lactone lactonase YvrE
MNVQLIQDARAILGEGVRNERSGRLHWVDIRAWLVHRFSSAGGSDSVFDFGQPVGSLGLGADGSLVLAICDEFGLARSGLGRMGQVVEVEKQLARNRINAGRCNASGRFWAGTMGSLSLMLARSTGWRRSAAL